MLKINENSNYVRPNSHLIYRILRAILQYRRYTVIQNDFEKRYPQQFFRLQYEDMLSNADKVISNCLSFLNLDWEDDILLERFEKNTSFPNGEPRDDYMNSKFIQTTISLLSSFVRLIPPGLFYIYDRFRRPRTEDPIPYLVPLQLSE